MVKFHFGSGVIVKFLLSIIVAVTKKKKKKIYCTWIRMITVDYNHTTTIKGNPQRIILAVVKDIIGWNLLNMQDAFEVKQK